jgi:protein disulfide-isomerase A6
MFLLFPFLGLSDVVDITTDNDDTFIGGPKPILVKFWLTTCHHCRTMAEDFEEASRAFTDVLFGGVECGTNSPLCDRHNVTGYPTLLLFPAGSVEGIEFNRTRSADAFCEFVEEHTKIKAKRAPSVFTDFNPVNFEKQISTFPCLLVTFYAPWCAHSRRWLSHARVAAGSMVPEPNVSLALSNCDQYHDLCDRYGVQSYPSVKLFHNDSIIQMTGPRTPENAIGLINEVCGTARQVGGLLNKTQGLVPEADAIVAEFLKNPSEELVEKVKKVKGAEFYVTVMERFRTGGEQQIRKDMKTMDDILESKRGSWAVLDGMKRRYNIFTQFVPTPVPEPTKVIEDAEGTSTEPPTPPPGDNL